MLTTLLKLAKVEMDAEVPPEKEEEISRLVAIEILKEALREGTISQGDISFVKSLMGQYERKKALSEAQWPHVVRLALATAPDPSMPEMVKQSPKRGVNSKDQRCAECRHTVKAGEGFYYLNSQGKWAVCHKTAECPDGEPDEPVQLGPGVYILTNGDYIHLYEYSPYGLVGQKWTGSKFTRVKGAKHIVAREGRLLTDGEMAIFASMVGAVGRSTSVCQFCNRPLTDTTEGHSVVRGYGPVCASKYNLPWG